MSFNDRVTDRQPHSHALGLRGEEAFEDAVPACWVETNTGISYVDDDVPLIVELRTTCGNWPRSATMVGSFERRSLWTATRCGCSSSRVSASTSASAWLTST